MSYGVTPVFPHNERILRRIEPGEIRFQTTACLVSVIECRIRYVTLPDWSATHQNGAGLIGIPTRRMQNELHVSSGQVEEQIHE